MNYSEYDIQYIKGVGEKRAKLFNKLAPNEGLQWINKIGALGYYDETL